MVESVAGTAPGHPGCEGSPCLAWEWSIGVASRRARERRPPCRHSRSRCLTAEATPNGDGNRVRRYRRHDDFSTNRTGALQHRPPWCGGGHLPASWMLSTSSKSSRALPPRYSAGASKMTRAQELSRREMAQPTSSFRTSTGPFGPKAAATAAAGRNRTVCVSLRMSSGSLAA